jgi:hypothetical protein
LASVVEFRTGKASSRAVWPRDRERLDGARRLDSRLDLAMNVSISFAWEIT